MNLTLWDPYISVRLEQICIVNEVYFLAYIHISAQFTKLYELWTLWMGWPEHCAGLTCTCVRPSVASRLSHSYQKHITLMCFCSYLMDFFLKHVDYFDPMNQPKFSEFGPYVLSQMICVFDLTNVITLYGKWNIHGYTICHNKICGPIY